MKSIISDTVEHQKAEAVAEKALVFRLLGSLCFRLEVTGYES